MLCAEALIRMDNQRLPKQIMVGILENPGRHRRKKQGERVDGLRGRRLPVVWDRGWGGWKIVALDIQVVENGDRGGSHVYGHLEEGRRESSQSPTK